MAERDSFTSRETRKEDTKCVPVHCWLVWMAPSDSVSNVGSRKQEGKNGHQQPARGERKLYKQHINTTLVQ